MLRFLRHATLAVLALALTFEATAVAQVYYTQSDSSQAIYSTEYSTLQTPLWRASLPNLHSYEVIGNSTGRSGPGAYNCFAHTLSSSGWVWPGTTIQGYDNLYAASGYRRAAQFDTSYNANTEKVVVYGRYNGGQLEVTHGTKQVGDNSWTSKLGSGPLIRHASLDSLSGPAYGSPVAVYTRQRFAPAAGNFQPMQQPMMMQQAVQPTAWQTGTIYRTSYR